jgi:hypothetical protein
MRDRTYGRVDPNAKADTSELADKVGAVVLFVTSRANGGWISGTWVSVYSLASSQLCAVVSFTCVVTMAVQVLIFNTRSDENLYFTVGGKFAFSVASMFVKQRVKPYS